MTKRKELLSDTIAVIGVAWFVISYIEIIVKQSSVIPLSGANVFVVLFKFANNILQGGIF